MSFFKLLLAFAPWLGFLVIAHVNLTLGLLVALALSVVMGVTGLHRGVILWSGLLFFCFATLFVGVLHNIWTMRHMGILANAFLAGSSWLTIAIGKPFSLDYAREHTDPSLWNSPDFIATNLAITAAWATVFSVNAVLAWGKMEHVVLPGLGFDAVSYSLLIGTAAFTAWYPGIRRRAREQALNEGG
jgi:hypothetical protein